MKDESCWRPLPVATKLMDIMRSTPRYDEEIIAVVQDVLLPLWERHGLSRLVTSAQTIKEFKAQNLPPAITVSIKKRCGEKVAMRGPRLYENTSYRIASWPEDYQETLRFPALACVLRGQADFHIADYIAHCPSGHFIVFNANVPQPDGRKPHFESEETANHVCEILWLFAPPTATNRIAVWICRSQDQTHSVRQLFDFCLLERAEVLTFYNTFMREVTEQPDGYHKMAQASFQAFLLLFARELKEGRFSHSPPGTDDNVPHHSPPIESALRYIDLHLNQKLTIQSVADAVFLSRSHFVRRFQSETGQSFNAHLTARRMEEARRLLAEETLSVGVVCRLVGLSPAQLRKLFRHHHGVSPSEIASAKRTDLSDT
jgi:AraC-like DNA-binding protein